MLRISNFQNSYYNSALNQTFKANNPEKKERDEEFEALASHHMRSSYEARMNYGSPKSISQEIKDCLEISRSRGWKGHWEWTDRGSLMFVRDGELKPWDGD